MRRIPKRAKPIENFDVKKMNINWTVIENKMLEDDRLTFSAKGVLVFLYSRPDEWEYDPKEVFVHAKNVEEAVDALLMLEEYGYLQEFKDRNKTDLDTQY